MFKLSGKLRQVVKFSSYKEQVYTEIKYSIINNLLKPNIMLNEREIAERLNVSRTPVREALKLLEGEGWVTILPWKGIFVSPIKKEDVEEVIQLRKSLETLAVDLMPKNIAEEDIMNLRSIVNQIEDHAFRKETKEFMEKDKKFHLYLAKKSGNSRLYQILDNLSDHMHRAGIQANSIDDRMTLSSHEHSNVLTAIEKADYIQAKTYLENHLENTRKAILASLTL